jgi:mediator of RNA polymerase II transcription subunit 17
VEVSDKTLNVVLKKKNIEKAKVLLKKSLEKISHDQEYSNIKFHLELYRARQMWRIKKIGSKFFCDLSYRTVGCVNSLKASVELFKNDIPINIKESTYKTQQYLSVIVPEELKDYAFIQIRIVKSNQKKKCANETALFDSKFSLFTGSPSSTTIASQSSNQSWQEVLDREQNAIYCKEIYNQLLREIFEPNVSSHLRPIITGNSIQMMITMNYDLIISLVHNPEKDNKFSQSCSPDYNFDNAILEYYLHSMLKKSFDQNFFHYDQRPITSTFAYNGQVKIAGMAYANLHDAEDSVTSLPNNISHLLSKKKKINLLASIREKAEHLILRKRVFHILNYVSRKVKEPNVYIEPSVWNSSSSTDITLTISSSHYATLAKSSFYIIIKQSNVTVLNRFSNLSVKFTDCIEDMKDYFLDQCCFHQINLITTMSQLFDWTVLSNSFTNELNNKFLSGLALIYNNKFSKKIGIRVGPVNRMEFYVNQFNNSTETEAINKVLDSDENLKNLLGDLNAEWIYIKDNYTKVDIDTYPGFTAIQKFELFLAHYSNKDFIDSQKIIQI